MKPQSSARFEFEKNVRPANAHSGKLRVGDSEIATPILWLGHRVGGKPRPWQVFRLPGLLMNAWDILSTGQASQKVREDGINEYLGLDPSCPTLLDSGGYLYLKRGNLKVDPCDVLKLYMDLAPTIGAVLDYPLDPFVEADANQKRWQQTLANTRLMFSRNGHLTLMPIIHAHSVSQAERACADLRHIIEEPSVLGIGSLVPLMRTRHDGRVLAKQSTRSVSQSEYHQSSRHLAVEIIRAVRAHFPDAFLHVFGVGGTTTMHLMFALGVDSIDSIGWRLKAGYGAVQLPGFGDRFTGDKPRRKRTMLKDDEKSKEVLLKCQCPVCQEHATLEKRLVALEKSFDNRALHNAWVFVREAASFRTKIETNSVESFVRERLRHSPLKSLLPAVFDQPERPTEELD
jgi:7-cyano-7-deazaguanine tRNA-ribosyltransferase